MSSEEAHQAWNTCSAGVPYPAGYTRGRVRDLAGFLATHPKPLPCSKTPAEPSRPRRLRSCRHRPRANQTEGLSGYIISRLTQGFSFRCLRFASDVAASRAKLASGWRAAPLPGGSRTLWIASKGFRLHPSSFPGLRLSQGSSTPSAHSPAQRPCSPILSRYTHRVAISNRRLIALDGRSVTFKVKDYRIEGPGRYTTMTLEVDEFIRRFLTHVLPKGFHRIRHYGLFASSNRTETKEVVRKLLNLAPPEAQTSQTDPAQPLAQPCPCCGGRMIIIETFEAGCQPRYRPATPPEVIRIDTS